MYSFAECVNFRETQFSVSSVAKPSPMPASELEPWEVIVVSVDPTIRSDSKRLEVSEVAESMIVHQRVVVAGKKLLRSAPTVVNCHDRPGQSVSYALPGKRGCSIHISLKHGHWTCVGSPTCIF